MEYQHKISPDIHPTPTYPVCNTRITKTASLCVSTYTQLWHLEACGKTLWGCEPPCSLVLGDRVGALDRRWGGLFRGVWRADESTTTTTTTEFQLDQQIRRREFWSEYLHHTILHAWRFTQSSTSGTGAWMCEHCILTRWRWKHLFLITSRCLLLPH